MLTRGTRWSFAVGALAVAVAAAAARQSEAGDGETVGPGGACCFGSGDCAVLPESLCDLSQGRYQGDGTTCATVDCPGFGACCFTDLTCMLLGPAECQSAGGTYQGDGSLCFEESDCPVTGACCLDDGGCIDGLTHAECEARPGEYMGFASTCATATCTGACAFSDGTCVDGTTPDGCAAATGAYQGSGVDCGQVDAPSIAQWLTYSVNQNFNLALEFMRFDTLGGTRELKRVRVEAESEIIAFVTIRNFSNELVETYVDVGEDVAVTLPPPIVTEIVIDEDFTIECTDPAACCFPGAACEVMTQAICTAAGGAYQGAGSTCAPPTCLVPQPGACCLQNGTCTDAVTADACEALRGVFRGYGSACADPDVLCPEFLLPSLMRCDYGGPMLMNGATAVTIDPPDTAFYEGAGLLSVPVEGAGEFGFDGSKFQLQNLVHRVEGRVRIVYEYEQKGACCLCDGTCSVETRTDCEALPGFVSWTEGAACADVVCDPFPTCTIVGPVTPVCPGTTGLAYALESPIPGATCAWTISGAGTFCDGSTTTTGDGVCVTADAACDDAFSLSVTCTLGNCETTCGLGPVAVVDVTPPGVTCPGPITVECESDVPPANIGLVSGTDDCGGPVTITHVGDGPLVGGPCGGTITRTYRGTDGCGNATDCTRIITVNDTTPPVFTVDPGDVTVECDGLGNPGDLAAFLGQGVATDACGPAGVTPGPCTLSDECGATGSCTVTFTATDACGNTATRQATFTIVDTTPPVFTVDPGDVTVECDGLGNPGDLAAFLGQGVATDACGPAVVTPGPCTLSDECGATGSCTVTFTATDACGNTATRQATFTIVDTTPPVFTVDPGDVTVECDGLGNPGDLAAFLGQGIATDACGPAGVTPGPCALSDGCGATGSCTVTFTAMDACGNTATREATFTIVDTTPPVVVCMPDLDLDCADTIPPPDPGHVFTSDACGTVDVVLVSDASDGGTCPETITRVYRGTDACGNSAECMRKITYDCGPGACCLPDMVTCVEGTTKRECAVDLGGVFLGACTTCDGTPCEQEDRVGCTEKGSLLYFSNVEIRWDVTGTMLVQDTFISITNDYPEDVLVKLYFINGDPPLEADPTTGERGHTGWNHVNNGFLLTANQPAYWSALTGSPGPGPGHPVTPFTALDPGSPPGRPARDGTDHRVLRGFIVAWAIDATGDEIAWNHLSGAGTIVSYLLTHAWEYDACAFRVLGILFDHGAPTMTPGVLHLDGTEYASAVDRLLMNFQASGSQAWRTPAFNVMSGTDLTLHPVPLDVRAESGGPVTTNASIEVWNGNETKFSGTHRCVTCWDQTQIGRYDPPNHFLRTFLQTEHGKARVDGVPGAACDRPDDPLTPEDESVTSVSTPMLGLAQRLLVINLTDVAASGVNLYGIGTQPAVIRYDAVVPPDEARWPPGRDEIEAFLDEMIRRLRDDGAAGAGGAR